MPVVGDTMRATLKFKVPGDNDVKVKGLLFKFLMNLQSISHIYSWGTVASVLNDNFEKVREAIESGNSEQSLAKGYLKPLMTSSCISLPSNIGDWGYVGTSFPAYIYTWNGTSWEKSEDQTQPMKY